MGATPVPGPTKITGTPLVRGRKRVGESILMGTLAPGDGQGALTERHGAYQASESSAMKCMILGGGSSGSSCN